MADKFKIRPPYPDPTENKQPVIWVGQEYYRWLAIDENPNAQTTQKHYTADKSATTLTTGYQTQFPITADLYKDNKVVEFIRDIGEEQKLGVEADYFRVRLYQPIPEKQNTYYARKFRVGFEISGITGAGGEIMSIDGNMNAIGDAVVGEFNISTKTFTPASEIPGA